MKKKKTLFIILAIVLVVAGGIAFIVHKIASIVPSVQAEFASYGEISSYISGTGRVAASGTRTYIAPTGVKVDKLNFEVGDVVKDGDIIAMFDAEDIDRQLKSMLLDLNSAKIDLNLALQSNEETRQKIEENKKERARLLFELDFFDKDDPEEYADYNDYKMEARNLKAANEKLEDTILKDESIQLYRNRVEKARLEYERLSKLAKEGKSDLVASASGVITRMDLVEGTPTIAGASVVVEENEELLVQISLSKYDLERAREGQSVSIRFGSDKFTGTLSKINAKAEPDGNVKAEITVDNPSDVLRIGIEVRVEILTYENENALIVPVEAIKTDTQGDYCYRLTPIEGGYYRPEKVYVEIGNSSELFIELLSGINEGDIIALNAQSNMEMMPIYNAILPASADAQ